MRRVLLSLTLATALGLSACRDDAGSPTSETPADTLATSPTRDMMDQAAYSDARFLQEMTAHHRMALDMAAMAQTMASSADLKAMAANMQRDQQREITDMTGLLRAMGQEADTSATGHEGMMGMPMTMDELHAAQPFDRAFLVAMIGHHSTAITMAAEAQAKSANAEVLAMARSITKMQAGEIGRMQTMLEAMPPSVVTAPADSAAHH